jgi:hypothetical protein
MICAMSRLVLVLVATLLLSCSQSRYQTSGGADGSPVTRIDTKTGETDVLVRTAGGRLEWRRVAERQEPKSVPDIATKTDCATIDHDDPYRDLFGC